MDRHIFLPLEVKDLILANFSHRELFTQIACVSTEWRRAVHDSFLWKTIKSNGEDDWNWALHIPKSIRDCVRSANIRNFQKSKNISILVDSFPFIQEIEITFANCKYHWIIEAFEQIVRWNLKSISLQYSMVPAEETIAVIRAAEIIVEKCKSIDSILYPDCYIDSVSFVTFTKCIGANLRRLHVGSVLITEPEKFRYLSTCVNLRDLQIRFVYDLPAERLLFLKNLRLLQRFVMTGRYCNNFAVVLEQVFRDTVFLHLEELHITMLVDDVRIGYLTRSCPNLRELTLVCIEFTDCGFNAIITRLHHLERLTLEVFSGTVDWYPRNATRICTISADRLMKIASYLPFLTEFHIHGSFELKRGTQDLELFRHQNPNLTIKIDSTCVDYGEDRSRVDS